MSAKYCCKGRFITFEGLDGTGKSTQIQLLASVLADRGINFVITREPGGTPLGEEIRAILLDSRRRGISPHAELALLFACRAQLLLDVIEPALNDGRWVICDRFTDSSQAYQGGGRQLGSDAVSILHKVLANNCQPWMTVLLDGDLEISLDRARSRNSIAGVRDEGRFEAESVAFFQRVQSRFREIAAQENHRVVMVDARRSVSLIHEEILQHLDRRLRYEDESVDTSAREMALDSRL
jgi:dTMP kinase